MSDSSNLIIFLSTQLLLPLGLAYVYCRKKGIPTDSWQAANLSLDELILSSERGHRQIALSSVAAVTSKHSLSRVRRYRSWFEHLAFVEFTLHNG